MLRRQASSGRSAQQRHGDYRLKPQDLEGKAQHYKKVLTVFHLNNKESKH